LTEKPIIKLKAKFERNMKEVSLDVIGLRTALNPDTMKNVSAPFLIHCKISVESGKHYADWTLTKAILPYKFTWMSEKALKIKIFVEHDSMCEEVYLTSPEPLGLVIEMSEPKKISPKEAQALVDAGSRVFELDEFDRLSSLAVFKIKR
jgi:hypothetical protein